MKTKVRKIAAIESAMEIGQMCHYRERGHIEKTKERIVEKNDIRRLDTGNELRFERP